MIHTLLMEQIDSFIGEQIDLFICSSSYEQRCKSVPFAVGADKVKTAIVACHDNVFSLVRENFVSLIDFFGEKSVKMHLNGSDPIASADAMLAALQLIKDDSVRTILVDITTFTHETLLILMKILFDTRHPGQDIKLAYSSSSDYGVNLKINDKWLSKGVRDIRSILGYPGEPNPTQKDHLIILVGFEHERAASLLDMYEPSIISLGYGQKGTATHQNHHDANQHFHKLLKTLLATHGANVSSFEFPCNDPIECKLAIQRCIHNNPGYNHIISPMNTKLSTIGCALTVSEDPSIQLCYAEPIKFNYAGYSTPGQNCYLVDFGELFPL